MWEGERRARPEDPDGFFGRQTAAERRHPRVRSPLAIITHARGKGGGPSVARVSGKTSGCATCRVRRVRKRLFIGRTWRARADSRARKTHACACECDRRYRNCRAIPENTVRWLWYEPTFAIGTASAWPRISFFRRGLHPSARACRDKREALTRLGRE